jgi:hypothetical protein
MRFRFPLSILALAACAPIAKAPTPESTRIEIRLPLPKDQAYDRTFHSFVAEGLNIDYASAGGGTLVSVPLSIDAVRSGVSEPILEPYSRKIIYRALVLAQGDTATVVLSGTVRDATFGAMQKEEPLHSQMKGILHDAWHRLERVAARLRGQAPQ